MDHLRKPLSSAFAMETLIKALHAPANQSSPDSINAIQKQIQRLQREEDGWRLGLELLNHQSSINRFYGALTLTIKINADWDNDKVGEGVCLKRDLLAGLVTSYLQLADTSEEKFVLQKVGSTLVAFFQRPDSGWKLPIRHVLKCIAHKSYLPEPGSPELTLPDAADFFASYRRTDSELKTALLLTKIFAEDLNGHFGSNAIGTTELFQRVAKNCHDALQLLRYCTLRAATELPGSNSTDILQMVMSAICFWTRMVPLAGAEEQDALGSLARDCIGVCTSCLGEDSLTTHVLQMLLSLEQLNTRFLRKATPDGFPYSLFTSPKCKEIVENLLRGDFTVDGILFVDLLDAVVYNIPSTETNLMLDDGYILLTLVRLLHCEGIAVIEDPVCQIVLEIISRIVEDLEYDGPSGDPNVIETIIEEAYKACLSKIKFPDMETLSWDADERAKFQDFRYDVHDFYQIAHSVAGTEIINYLIETISSQGVPPDWSTFEAALFGLMAFSDRMSQDPQGYEDTILGVLDCSAWNYLLGTANHVPDRALQTGIKFISENIWYLNLHPDKLVPTLNFLFSSLHLEASTSFASRAIHNLCNSYRGKLTEGLPTFMSSLDSLGDVGEAERHRIYAAVAAIVQALPSDEAKVQPIEQLLGHVSRAQETLQNSGADMEEVVRGCTDIMQTLASIGKGLRGPEDVSPTKSGANGSHTGNSSPNDPQFWTKGPGAIVQEKVCFMYNLTVQMVQMVQPKVDNAFVDACCDFIKSGFTEPHPAPFKFEDSLALDLVRGLINVENPSIDNTLECATSFLASISAENLQAGVGGILEAVIPGQHQILVEFGQTQQLPSTSYASASLTFLSRVFRKRGKEWFSMPDSNKTVAVAMELGLLVMADVDTVPRRSAAAFFAAFAELTGPRSELDGEAELRCKASFIEFGHRILTLLLRLLAGECARSELESLSETLRRFVQNQPMFTKSTFMQAITDNAGTLNEKALKATTLEQRSRFITQFDLLRGTWKTNAIVKEFWIACRGDGFGYIT